MKTKFGGAVSIICVVVMVLLFASEIRLYLTPEVREELVVDTTRTGKLKINIDFVFSRYESCFFEGCCPIKSFQFFELSTLP